MAQVIQWSQQLTKNYTQFKITPLISQWLEAKDKFVKRFKKEKEKHCQESYSDFIYEFPEPMSFTLDEPTRKSKVDGFVDYLIDYLYDEDIQDSVASNFCNFLKKNADGFFENKVVWGTVWKDNVINEGMKLLKSFKFFLSGDILEAVQNKASVLIQESKITGRLCISVHPLDYLSASETNYDWRSCHALDGDYRAGNLAYMTDTCTVMCYLRGEDKVVLPRFPESVPWNNKKWRMLLFVGQDENIIWAGRQYPYESKSILEAVEKMVIPVITGIDYYDKNYWWGQYPNFTSWSDKTLEDCELNDEYVNLKGYLFAKRALISDTNDLYYDDLLRSTKYKPSFIVKYDLPHYVHLRDSVDNRSTLEKIHLQVGANPKCPCCGVNEIEFSDEMICVQCDELYGTQANDEFVFCNNCGVRVYQEDAYNDDGEWYCRDCWEDY